MSKIIEKEIKIGQINSLKVEEKSEYGYILVASNSTEKVLYTTDKKFDIGDVLDLFVYTSAKGKLHATHQTPNTFVDQFNIFEIKEIKKDGVFVDWGIEKDLFVPNKHHNAKFRFGENKILKVVYDKELKQLVGSETFYKSLIKRPKGLKRMDKLSCIVLSKIPHGYKVIADNKFEAIILNEDLEDKIFRIGSKFEAVIRKIKDDGALIVKLKQQPSKKRSNISDHIYKILEKNGGSLECGLKTEPEKIKEIFNLSKKSFKTSALDLQASDEVELTDNSITII